MYCRVLKSMSTSIWDHSSIGRNRFENTAVQVDIDLRTRQYRSTSIWEHGSTGRHRFENTAVKVDIDLRTRQYRSTSIWEHGSTSQKTLNFILAAVRTWNLTYKLSSHVVEMRFCQFAYLHDLNLCLRQRTIFNCTTYAVLIRKIVKYEFWKICTEVAVAYFKTIPAFAWRNRRKSQTTSVGIREETRTLQLRNTNLECYSINGDVHSLSTQICSSKTEIWTQCA
jgi:hypothetical protein